MPNAYRQIAFTDAVKTAQEAMGSRAANAAQAEAAEATGALLGEGEAIFLALRDSFYMATVSQTGWPYIQHRGGPPGFVRVLDETTIGWAEFAGNRQYVTTGNLAGEARVSLFFMEYRHRRRLKMFGRARLVAADDPLVERLRPEGYRARIERGMVVEVAGFDWNCPQHIVERFTLPEVEQATARMMARIAELEAKLGI